VKTLLILPNLNESWDSVKLVCEKTREIEKEKTGEDLDVIHVEREKIFKQSKGFLKYKKIICLDHSIECLQSLKFIKNILKDDLSLHFYVLGMASSFFWPLHKWGLVDFLGNSDRIIVSCSRDLLLTQYALPNIQAELKPFRFYEVIDSKKDNPNMLFYIGRLSFLKNIHGLIHFFNDYRKVFPKASLEIIGDWDTFDLPFFETELDRDTNPNIYKDYIFQLISKYEIQNEISFLGKKSQDEVTHYLKNTNGKFISLSLQNDENYGLAADQALSTGHQAILSDWGGHAELKKIFPSQVSLVEVSVTDKGPSIASYSSNKEYETTSNLPKASIPVAEIITQRENFNRLKNGDVLFNDQRDPYYHFFSQIYAGKESLQQREQGHLLFGCEEILKQS
jgi:glycosyltransferase involved in cell wall biosynthesis